MERRGATHIEVILSFIIFAAVVGFALYFFNPAGADRLADTTLSYAFREIEENTSTEVLMYSILIDRELLQDLENPETVAFNIIGIGDELNIIGENSDGNLFRGRKVGEISYLNAPEGTWQSGDLVYLKFSEDFEEVNFDTTNIVLNEDIYEISSSRISNLISEKRFLALNRSYHENYLELKKSFNLPDRVNFGFELSFADGSGIKAERDFPQEFEVYSDSKRVEVMRENGKAEYANLVVKVW